MLAEEIKEYIEKLSKEKESLIAKYITETGLKPSEIVIVTKHTNTGEIFWVDKKEKHITGNEEVISE